MSMMDPDQRERMERESERRRAECQKSGHMWGAHTGTCNQCGSPNPAYAKPHVSLIAGEFRAVYDPQKGTVTIEKRSQDAIGGERWDAIDAMSNTASRSEKSHLHVFELLAKGRRP